jgi:hypothetical protein
MGAGDRGGPECRAKACQGRREEFDECNFRHEHAVDEQRIRYLDVA